MVAKRGSYGAWPRAPASTPSTPSVGAAGRASTPQQSVVRPAPPGSRPSLAIPLTLPPARPSQPPSPGATTPGHRNARVREYDSTNQICGVTETIPPGSGSLVGRRIGRYVIDGLLGKGGMATVWRAVHAELGGEVAIKILAPEAVRGEEEIQRFFREAKVSAQLNHDHVVRVIDFARDPELGAYIVMELLRGLNLDRVLRAEGPLEEGRAVALALQIADALVAAHAHGIIHRDLKPANIFVTRTLGAEVVKVVDFGIAKVPTSSMSLTRPGEIYGTPRYMSPEQWEGAPITEASDIYSIGVVLYEMLAGKVPVTGPGWTQLAINVALNDIAPIATHRPGISPSIDAIVLRCLRKNPSERFGSMRELQEALERVRDGFDVTFPLPGGSIPPISSDASPNPRRRRSRWRFVPLLATIATVAAGIGYVSGRWPESLRLLGSGRPASAPATAPMPTEAPPPARALPAESPEASPKASRHPEGASENDPASSGATAASAASAAAAPVPRPPMTRAAPRRPRATPSLPSSVPRTRDGRDGREPEPKKPTPPQDDDLLRKD